MIITLSCMRTELMKLLGMRSSTRITCVKLTLDIAKSSLRILTLTTNSLNSDNQLTTKP